MKQTTVLIAAALLFLGTAGAQTARSEKIRADDAKRLLETNKATVLADARPAKGRSGRNIAHSVN